MLFPGGRQAAAACEDGSIAIFNTENGKGIGRLQGHRGEVYCLSLSRDGKVLVSGSQDGTVRLWDTTQGAELSQLKVSGREVRAVSPLS